MSIISFYYLFLFYLSKFIEGYLFKVMEGYFFKISEVYFYKITEGYFYEFIEVFFCNIYGGGYISKSYLSTIID